MDLDVRPARPDEYGAVGELTLRAYLADGHIAEGSDYGNELRRARHRAEHTDLLVAVDTATGELLGTVAFVRADSEYAEVAREGEAEFRMLAVAPEARGRGAGEALARACLDRARGLGLRRLVLSSGARMHTAHRLYTRLGFTRLPSRDWSPVPGVDLQAFTCDL
jgi:GNAT superfamily N-acetyltransferase